MKTNYLIILIAGFSLLVVGCGGKHHPQPVLPPGAATLISPAQNQVCTSGTIISDSQTSVTFMWGASDHTDNYELNIKNLLTGTTTTEVSSGTQQTVTLSRATPYSWYVVSKSTGTTETAQSDTWKFYTAGAGVVSYAPFPSELDSPTFGQVVTATNGMINLVWKGSAVGNDIAGYDIYFGPSTPPPILDSGIINMFLDNVKVKSGTTYYWRVVTKDSVGNTSNSGVWQFTVKQN